MPYTDLTSMTTRFGVVEITQLTDRAGIGTIDTAVLDAAIAAADAEIDGYVQVRHSLPLPRIPLLIAHLAMDIARYQLYDDQVTKVVAERYKDAQRKLEGIAKGLIHLGLDDKNKATPTDHIMKFTGPKRTFSRQTTRGY